MNENDFVVPEAVMALIEAGERKKEAREFEEWCERGLAIAQWESEWKELEAELRELLPEAVRPWFGLGYDQDARPTVENPKLLQWLDGHRAVRVASMSGGLHVPGCEPVTVYFEMPVVSRYAVKNYLPFGSYVYVDSLEEALFEARRFFTCRYGTSGSMLKIIPPMPETPEQQPVEK
jgi:hypothetical protein